MQEITLDELFNMWTNYSYSVKSIMKLEEYKKNKKLKKFKIKFFNFGEYHTQILKEGKYRIK